MSSKHMSTLLHLSADTVPWSRTCLNECCSLQHTRSGACKCSLCQLICGTRRHSCSDQSQGLKARTGWTGSLVLNPQPQQRLTGHIALDPMSMNAISTCRSRPFYCLRGRWVAGSRLPVPAGHCQPAAGCQVPLPAAPPRSAPACPACARQWRHSLDSLLAVWGATGDSADSLLDRAGV